jgi:four helix bundle protein
LVGRALRARRKAEFISKVGDCLKEADETLYWLELLSDEQIIAAKRLAPLIQEASERVSILVAISQRARGE